MKRAVVVVLIIAAVALTAYHVLAMSRRLPEPEIDFPKGYNTNRIEQVHKVLRSDKVKYLGGLVSYWEPEWGTTLVYDGDSEVLTTMLTALNQVEGITVRLTFSKDLAKETGSLLSAGSWWVMYSHTKPDTITVRINLASENLGGEKFQLTLPKVALQSWAEQYLVDFNSIKAGMTRSDVEKKFKLDGGLQGASPVRFAHAICPFLKVDVEFDFKRNAADQNRAVIGKDDKVVRVSKPYLERPFMD